MVFVCSKTFEPDAMGTKHFGGLLLIYAPPQTNLSLEQSSMLRVLFWSNAPISGVVCEGGLCAKMRACEHAHKSTARTTSAALACYADSHV